MAETLPSPMLPGVDNEDFAFQPSPHSASFKHDDPFSSPPAPPLQNDKFASTLYEESSGENTDEVDYVTEDEDGTLLRAGGGTSNRSSISSFPGSIVPVHSYEDVARDLEPQETPTKSPKILHHHRSGSLGYKIKSPVRDAVSGREYGGREYSPAFRNPSSVRAMQMRDEEPFDEDDRRRSLSGHKRRGSRMSVFSHRSGNSTQTSPTKRKSSPLKPSVKTEFPLVLLHCTLLPPTLGAVTLPLSLHGPLSAVDEESVLKETLPDVYWRRWKLLREKVQKNVEVRTRGVLISHPKADYEMLEERLLESLELEGARIREGHYSAANDNDTVSDREECEADEAAEAAGLKTKCLDCGKKVSMGVEVGRKWEVKVYAANGLMRAGAWSAAWSEMEKVDVEVGVWMPEDVRREVEERLIGLGFGLPDEEVGDEHENNEEDDEEEERRRREVYEMDREEEDRQAKTDGLYEEEVHHAHQEPQFEQAHTQTQQHYQPQETSIQDLLLNYLKLLTQDRRNVFIAFLSVLVLFYAMNSPAPATTREPAALMVSSSSSAPVPQAEVVTMTVTSISISTSMTTSTAIFVSTTTIIESVALDVPEPPRTTADVGFSAESDVPLPETTTLPESTPKAEPLEEPLEEQELEVVPEDHEMDEAKDGAKDEVDEALGPSVAEIVVDMLVGDGDGLME